MGTTSARTRRPTPGFAQVSAPKSRPGPTDDEPVVDWEDFERATDLVVADQRPQSDQPREPTNSR